MTTKGRVLYAIVFLLVFAAMALVTLRNQGPTPSSPTTPSSSPSSTSYDFRIP